jgi:salicylate hydroxylase
LVKDILALAKDVKQYALFAGPRLESIVSHGSVALVGDASHRKSYLSQLYVSYLSLTC